MSAYTEGRDLAKRYTEAQLSEMQKAVSLEAIRTEAFTTASQCLCYDFHALSAALLFKKGEMDADAARFYKRK